MKMKRPSPFLILFPMAGGLEREKMTPEFLGTLHPM